ncbi:DinB family protein [Sporocytophaga myxococcoides]|uniref:DinB family protein n=1 Tax=Sporocytophaga myxococcoides TaxID=153721 RepID=UPI0003FFF0A3|nr:DinB family protein [Sporocytophaga myxococcoides]
MLTKEQAHISFAGSVEGIDYKTAGKSEKTFPYNIWQLSSHIQFTQKDILEFCTNNQYKEPKWPDDYWPSNAKPTQQEWQDCLSYFQEDRNSFVNLIKNPSADLLAPIPHGTGQNLLREAILICDHTAYHTGQIVLLRKLLGNW